MHRSSPAGCRPTRPIPSRTSCRSVSVPAIRRFENRNILIVDERRRRLSPQDCAEALRLLAELDIERVEDVDEAYVLDLARRRRLTVHDAAYPELAVRTKRPLATLGRALLEAARREGVPLVGIDA